MIADASAADLARFALVLAMAVLAAGVARVGIDRRNREAHAEAPAWALPWWSVLGWLGFILYAAAGQTGRINQGPLSWAWYVLTVSTVIGLAGVGTVVQRRRRR